MATKKSEKAVENEPNVVFTGKRKMVGKSGGFDLIEKEVPKAVSVPSGKIVLPGGVKHGEPFYHADANILIANSKDFESPTQTGN